MLKNQLLLLALMLTQIACGRIGFDALPLDSETETSEDGDSDTSSEVDGDTATTDFGDDSGEVGSDSEWATDDTALDTVTDTTTADTATSDTATSDTATSDTVTSDSATADTATADTATADTATADTATADTATADTATADTATADTATEDTATEDTATEDTDTEDTSTETTQMVNCVDVAPANGTSTVVQVEINWDGSSWSTPVDCAWSCDTGYHTEDSITCLSDSQMVDCDDISPPLNGHQEEVLVEITWDGSFWSAPDACDWACDTGHHTEDNATCVSDTQMVDCTDAAPANGTSTVVQVPITWGGSSWSTPADCAWSCDTGYHTEDSVTCVSDTQMVDCTDAAPTNGTSTLVQVPITWGGSSWSTPADCAWSCDTGYHTEDSVTCVSDTQMVDCTDAAPANGTSTVAQVPITWGGSSWSTPADCAWTCDSGYVTLDGETCVEECASLPGSPIEHISESDMPSFLSFSGDTVVTPNLVGVGGGQPHTQAWQTTTGTYTETSDKAQLYLETQVYDVYDGDHMVMEFWVRCLWSSAATCRTGGLFEQVDDPWAHLVEYFVAPAFADGWVFYQVPFVATTNYSVGTVRATFRLGYPDQQIEIAPIRIVNYETLMPTDRPDCLPDSTNIYDSVEIMSWAPTTATVGTEYRYSMEVNGLPTPTFEISTLPSWLTQGTNSVHGTPQASDVGTTIPITATWSNENDTDQETWQITVNN